MNVSLRQLKVFLAVATTRSFSRAGTVMHLTQPAVSRWISELESELGVRLLDRTTREVELTEAGSTLAGVLDRLIDDLESALLETRTAAEQKGGKVRVASVPTLSANLMPDCIADCARHHPNIKLLIRDQSQSQLLESIRTGAVDFGLAIEPRDTKDLHTETLLPDPFKLVCRKNHPLAERNSARWTDLDQIPLVLLDHSSGSRRIIDEALAAHGVEAEIAQEVGHLTTAYQMIEKGIGVGIVPAMGLPFQQRSLRTLPLLPEVSRSIMLLRRDRRSLSPPAERAWELIAEVARRRSRNV